MRQKNFFEKRGRGEGAWIISWANYADGIHDMELGKVSTHFKENYFSHLKFIPLPLLAVLAIKSAREVIRKHQRSQRTKQYLSNPKENI